MFLGKLAQGFQHIYRVFYQTVLFDNEDRREFLQVIHTQLAFDISLGQILQNIQRTGSSPQIQKIAKQSAKNLTIFNDCTRNWADYFPLKDTLLLRSAMRQDNLSKGIDLVLDSKQEAVSFVDAVIKTNTQYIVFVVGFIIMLLILASQRSMLSAFNPDMLLFDYIDWLYQWGPVIVATAVGLLLVYLVLRQRLLGKSRSIAYKLGIYLAYDRLIASQFCVLASDALKSGSDMTEITHFCSKIFTHHRQLYGLFAMRQRLTDGFSIAAALRNTLFEPRYSDYLASFAPSEGREQLAMAFEKVAELLNTNIAQQFRQTRYILMSALLLLGFILFYPLLQLMTGAAMPSSM